MNQVARIALAAAALALGLALAGCENFDPTSLLDNDFFSTKKKLPGERQPVFPEGTPGVPQGVPQELVKGYQPAAEPEPVKQAQPVEPKPKARPKPKIVAKPKEERGPTAVTVRPAQSQPQASQAPWPDPPPQRPAAAPAGGGGWPGSSQPTGGVAWPDPPAPR
jgi:hypothetical protein